MLYTENLCLCETIVRDRFFLRLISPLFAVKKSDTQNNFPEFDSPIHGEHDSSNCNSVHPFVRKLSSF